MKFTRTALDGVFIVDLEPHSDERGFFARAFCAEEFHAHGLKPAIAQCNVSFNHRRGTLRGLHWQLPPAGEAKFIRCVSGALYDVIVDMRPESPTYLQHLGTELSADNHRAVYVPEMFAHGYQALSDGATALYSVSEFYTPDCELGIRFDDPLLRIELPLEVTCISEKDRSWPDFVTNDRLHVTTGQARR